MQQPPSPHPDAPPPHRLRPSADITDPFLCHRAYAIPHVGISAFLMALAAWQRGLEVRFHYELATKCPRFAKAAIQGFRGELFSVSDGRRTHYFSRTLGDRTSREQSDLCQDKQTTKEHLMADGLPVPPGMVIAPGETAKAQTFMAEHPGQRFVLKPLDGTLGEGVELKLSPEAVSAQLQQAQRPLLLEVFIPSDYYRVYVVDGRVVNAYINLPASVVGDGRRCIRELVEEKNRTRPHRPLYREKRLKLRDREREYLAAQGLDFDSVPAAGQSVAINDSIMSADGADRQDRTDQLSPSVRHLAEQAGRSLGLPFVGLDILLAWADGQAYVLEANQKAIIVGNVFPTRGPSPGNTVAEAIMDEYFPESADNLRHTKASFDFMKICDTLQSGVVGEVSLPVLGPDWVHRRFRVAAPDLKADTLSHIREAMYVLGIHAQWFKTDPGDLIVDVVAPEQRYQAFLTRLQAT